MKIAKDEMADIKYITLPNPFPNHSRPKNKVMLMVE